MPLMKGRGSFLTYRTRRRIGKINVSDSGNGIHQKPFKTVFEPGLQLKKTRLGIRLS
jgi:signal transduction histidine kinase